MNSNFKSVLGHEWRYFKSLKNFRLPIFLLTVAPATFVALYYYYFRAIDYSLAALIVIWAVPRIPLNLVAYSVGGERVYKTGESLISTPIKMREMFLGKCAVPALVSCGIVIVSFVLTILTGNIISRFIAHETSLVLFSAEQLILMFGVGIMSAVASIFVTAILTFITKQPRQGLFLAAVVSFLFVLPAIAIAYWAPHKMLWSCAYFSILTVFNLACVNILSAKATRAQIMKKL